jgi:hypothetical protein
MPEAVERWQRYPDMATFEADRGGMERRGWKVSSVRLGAAGASPEAAGHGSQREHTEVDVEYTRGGWSVEDWR